MKRYFLQSWLRPALLMAGILVLAGPLVAQQSGTRIEDVSFSSAALGRQAVFSVVVPSQPPPAGGYPVLMILHGLGRNHRTLLENGGTLALLQAQPFLIVLPDSEKGWWIDSPVSGKNYDGMLLEVVSEVQTRFPVSRSSQQWGVMGWSMGGFGTLHFAERHPQLVSFVGSIIGLLDFPRVDGLPDGQRFPVDGSVFGSDASAWAQENPSHHLAPLAGKDLEIVIAEQAFDRTMNENFIQQAQAAGLHLEIYRIEGEHVFTSVIQGLGILLPRAAAHFGQTSIPAMPATQHQQN
jgi:S-formylglutathione hydrolase FrmB